MNKNFDWYCKTNKYFLSTSGGGTGDRARTNENFKIRNSELKDKIVTDGGDNFSVGQRQLLCIARAMLRYSNVLILDECSSACDAQTDENIQTTIQSHFKASTVLCIAHRLKTIAGYDLILVMDDGKVAEIGTPASLLENDGLFRAMCEASGDFDELSALATATRHQHYG